MVAVDHRALETMLENSKLQFVGGEAG